MTPIPESPCCSLTVNVSNATIVTCHVHGVYRLGTDGRWLGTPVPAAVPTVPRDPFTTGPAGLVGWLSRRG